MFACINNRIQMIDVINRKCGLVNAQYRSAVRNGCTQIRFVDQVSLCVPAYHRSPCVCIGDAFFLAFTERVPNWCVLAMDNTLYTAYHMYIFSIQLYLTISIFILTGTRFCTQQALCVFLKVVNKISIEKNWSTFQWHADQDCIYYNNKSINAIQ